MLECPFWNAINNNVSRYTAYSGHGSIVNNVRMPFSIIGRTGPGMRQVVGFGDRSIGRDTFGGECGTRHCNQWGLYGVRVRQCRDAALFPNYFEQTCNFWHLRTERQRARMSKNINGGLDQYGAEPFEQQQFGTAGVEGVNARHSSFTLCFDDCFTFRTSNYSSIISHIRKFGRMLVVVAVPSFHGRYSDAPVSMPRSAGGSQLRHAVRHMERCLHSMSCTDHGWEKVRDVSRTVLELFWAENCSENGIGRGQHAWVITLRDLFICLISKSWVTCT